MTVDQHVLDQITLTREEYALACERLDREPNEVELGMIGALWSEHCGYKNSRPLLRLLPNTGPRVLTKAGEENAAERVQSGCDGEPLATAYASAST